jgi:hypothetical protein
MNKQRHATFKGERNRQGSKMMHHVINKNVSLKMLPQATGFISSYQWEFRPQNQEDHLPRYIADMSLSQPSKSCSPNKKAK